MEKISIVIKTLDRSATGSINYLGETLRNLKRGGVFHSPHLGSIDIVDGGFPDFIPYIQREVGLVFPEYGINCQTRICTLQQRLFYPMLHNIFQCRI